MPWLATEQSIYVEPYFGAGGVFFAKARASSAEIINDLNGHVINFFRCLRDHPNDLQYLCQMTPYAREEFEFCRDTPLADMTTLDGKLENARRMFVLSRQGYMGDGGGMSGWRTGGSDYARPRGSELSRSGPIIRGARSRVFTDKADSLHLLASRLRDVTIENDDALKNIRKYDHTQAFIYLDPPYVTNTRHNVLYTYEQDDDHHVALLALLLQCRAKIAISGYPSTLYDDALSDWQRVEFHTAMTVTPSDSPEGRLRTEVLWMNYEKQPRLL